MTGMLKDHGAEHEIVQFCQHFQNNLKNPVINMQYVISSYIRALYNFKRQIHCIVINSIVFLWFFSQHSHWLGNASL